jgi:hypothetical protein
MPAPDCCISWGPIYYHNVLFQTQSSQSMQLHPSFFQWTNDIINLPFTSQKGHSIARVPHSNLSLPLSPEHYSSLRVKQKQTVPHSSNRVWPSPKGVGLTQKTGQLRKRDNPGAKESTWIFKHVQELWGSPQREAWPLPNTPSHSMKSQEDQPGNNETSAFQW